MRLSPAWSTKWANFDTQQCYTKKSISIPPNSLLKVMNVLTICVLMWQFVLNFIEINKIDLTSFVYNKLKCKVLIISTILTLFLNAVNGSHLSSGIVNLVLATLTAASQCLFLLNTKVSGTFAWHLLTWFLVHLPELIH